MDFEMLLDAVITAGILEQRWYREASVISDNPQLRENWQTAADILYAKSKRKRRQKYAFEKRLIEMWNASKSEAFLAKFDDMNAKLARTQVELEYEYKRASTVISHIDSERDELRMKLADANAEIKRLKKELVVQTELVYRYESLKAYSGDVDAHTQEALDFMSARFETAYAERNKFHSELTEARAEVERLAGIVGNLLSSGQFAKLDPKDLKDEGEA